MIDVLVNGKIERRGRDGKGQLVHYYVGNPDAGIEGFKKGINQDLLDNYRVKIHYHKFRRDGDTDNCEVLEPSKESLLDT